MKQETIDKLAASLATLDADNDEQWNANGTVNMEWLNKAAGTNNIALSTIVAHGLAVTREEWRARQAAPAAPEIKDPGAVKPEAVEAALMPQEPGAPVALPLSTGVSFHRDRKALSTVDKNLDEIVALLQASPKLSGEAQAFLLRVAPFAEEVKRALARG